MTITGKAQVAGVMGWPIGHSLSPKLHGFWLDQFGVDGAYVPLAVRPERLEQALRALPALGFRGVNLTVPHKEAATALVDEIDAAAARIGAINVVVVDKDGRLVGTNTDGFGFLENLRQEQPDWDASGESAMLLGAGGAARAVSHALADSGAERIVIANRNRARAEALVDDLNSDRNRKIATAVDWAGRSGALDGTGLLVNTTSLGMTGQPSLELDLGDLPGNAIVNDIVYSPRRTPLLVAAAKRGNGTVDGLGMLLHQARPAFAAWFGHDPQVGDQLREHILSTEQV
jgi:shikimate dehydrogenase